MSNITKIKIDNERERSYQDFPANREFKKRAEDDNPGGWPSDLPLPTSGGYGYSSTGEPTTVKTNSGTVSEDGGALIIDESEGEAGAPHDWHIGDILTVTINGVTYQVPFRDDGYGSWDAGAARNESSYFDIDWSEYDFIVHVSWDDTYYEYTSVIFQHAGTYDVSMTVVNETIHKIDEKYLPEAGGYDELSDGNITEVGGKKVLTPLGGGVVIKPIDVEITMTATEDGDITWGEEHIAEGELIVGETYRVTVNGVTGDYVCYVDEYDQKIIGTFEDDMAVGDWQIVSYQGAGVYVNVYGDVGEQFTFKVYGKTEAVHTIDRQYLPYVPSSYYLLVANGDGHYSADDARGVSMTVKDANNFISNPKYYGVPLVSCTNGAVHRFYIDSVTFVTKFDNVVNDVVDVHYIKVSSCLNLDGNDDDVALFDFINQ